MNIVKPCRAAPEFARKILAVETLPCYWPFCVANLNEMHIVLIVTIFAGTRLIHYLVHQETICHTRSASTNPVAASNSCAIIKASGLEIGKAQHTALLSSDRVHVYCIMFQQCLLHQPKPPPDLPPLLDADTTVASLAQSAPQIASTTASSHISAVADDLSEKNGAIQLIYQFLVANGLRASAAVLAAESHVQRMDGCCLYTCNVFIADISTLGSEASLITLLRMASSVQTEPSRESVGDNEPKESVLFNSTDGSVRAASVVQLVNMWCDPDACTPAFEHALVMSLCAFASAAEVVQVLRNLYGSGRRTIKHRVCSALCTWLLAQPPAPQEVHDAARVLVEEARKDGLPEVSQKLVNTILQSVQDIITCC